jgi:hypothetical protein
MRAERKAGLIGRGPRVWNATDQATLRLRGDALFEWKIQWE